MGKQSKSEHKFGGTKVCEAHEVRYYFTNPKTENEAFGQFVNLVWISEKFHGLFSKNILSKVILMYQVSMLT